MQPKLAEQRKKVAQLQDEMVDIKAARRGDSNKFAGKLEKQLIKTMNNMKTHKMFNMRS